MTPSPVKFKVTNADETELECTLNDDGNLIQTHDITVANAPPTAAFSFGPSVEMLIEVDESNSLSDAVKIEVTIPNDPEEEDEDMIVAGRIWLFDLGFIKYEVSSSQTTREMIF